MTQLKGRDPTKSVRLRRRKKRMAADQEKQNGADRDSEGRKHRRKKETHKWTSTVVEEQGQKPGPGNTEQRSSAPT